MFVRAMPVTCGWIVVPLLVKLARAVASATSPLTASITLMTAENESAPATFLKVRETLPQIVFWLPSLATNVISTRPLAPDGTT